jgi:hypothetical protein
LEDSGGDGEEIDDVFIIPVIAITSVAREKQSITTFWIATSGFALLAMTRLTCDSSQ